MGEERANVSRRVRGEHVRDADEVNDGPAGAILEADNPRRPGRGRPPRARRGSPCVDDVSSDTTARTRLGYLALDARAEHLEDGTGRPE